jgi:hypothetical protein
MKQSAMSRAASSSAFLCWIRTNVKDASAHLRRASRVWTRFRLADSSNAPLSSTYSTSSQTSPPGRSRQLSTGPWLPSSQGSQFFLCLLLAFSNVITSSSLSDGEQLGLLNDVLHSREQRQNQRTNWPGRIVEPETRQHDALLAVLNGDMER